MAVGFSKGCAPFTLKKPPPLVPKHLDGDLAGDRAERERLLGTLQRRRLDEAARVCGMPSARRTSAKMTASGSRI